MVRRLISLWMKPFCMGWSPVHAHGENHAHITVNTCGFSGNFVWCGKAVHKNRFCLFVLCWISSVAWKPFNHLLLYCSHAILIYLASAFPGVADHWYVPLLYLYGFSELVARKICCIGKGYNLVEVIFLSFTTCTRWWLDDIYLKKINGARTTNVNSLICIIYSCKRWNMGAYVDLSLLQEFHVIISSCFHNLASIFLRELHLLLSLQSVQLFPVWQVPCRCTPKSKGPRRARLASHELAPWFW